MTILALLATGASASSHREAPAISLDPGADLTDFYAFVSPEDPDNVIFILNAIPLQTPGGGPNFHRFDDTVTYNIKCDNEGDGLPDRWWQFKFTTTFNYPDEFLYNLGDIADPANLNITQTYSVDFRSAGVVTNIAQDLRVAPANVGVVSDPGRGYTPEATSPGAITQDYIETVGTYRFFAGPRQESFFVDLERTFDLLNVANNDNTNTLLGLNVHSIVMEVPKIQLTKDGAAPDAALQNEVIACWTTASRPRMRRYETDATPTYFGKGIQISRLGSPLVNEVVIPIGQKDQFNYSRPINDIQFLSYVAQPILPFYMEAVLGIPDPGAYDDPGVDNAIVPQPARDDLILTFLTGHPALGTLPGGFALGGPIPGTNGKNFAAFEALRMNLTATTSSYPNGRALQDDIVDVSLSAMAGLLIDGTFIPDGVGSEGISFLNEFPFIGDPWAGDDHPAAFHDL